MGINYLFTDCYISQTDYKLYKRNCKKGLQSWCGILYNNEVVKSDIQFIVGVDDVEGPPVPMPNTEVKLDSAENTRMVTSREDRKMPTSIILHSSVGRAHDC